MLVSQKFYWFLVVLVLVEAEPPVNGVRPSNVLGGLGQHASFSFVRPGLTQTAFAFNGPSSHQAFSSSIGNPHLAHKVQPSLAHALSYRNPGLGYTPVGPISTAYVSGPPPAAAITYQTQPQQQQLSYQQALALAYQQQQQQQHYQQQHQQQQQQQQYQQQHQQQQQQQQYQQQYQQQQQQYQEYQQQLQQQAYAEYNQQIQAQPVIDSAAQQSIQQAHLARLLATRFAQAQPAAETVPEQVQLQQQEAAQLQQQQQQQDQQQSTSNLLGVAYSAAPSVAHVKVNGNGYKFDF